jgi:hypothetical protein
MNEVLTCPKCHGTMRTHVRQGVQIEQCDMCRGVFLDYGELEALSRMGAPQHPQPAHPAPYPQPPMHPQYHPNMAQHPGWGNPQPGWGGHPQHYGGLARMLFFSS